MKTFENNEPLAETQEQLVLKSAKYLAIMIENTKGLKSYLDELKELKWELKRIQSSIASQVNDVVPSLETA